MSDMLVKIASPHGRLTASFAPQAGMVCSSLSFDGRELLEQRRGLEVYAEQGKTMGIPLLYPWANRLARSAYELAGQKVELPADAALIPRDPNDLPNHGVIPGRMRWSVEAVPDRARLTGHLRWTEAPLIDVFPFRHAVRMEVTVSENAVTVSTTVTAGEDPVPVSFGFHPYLRLPGTRSECAVELPASARLRLDRQGIPTGGRTILEPRMFSLLESEWDDGLALNDPVSRFSVAGPNGTVAVELLEGFWFGQVFAPPGSDFICFEPMTAPTNALISGEGLRILGPGESHRASFRIVVS